MSTRFTDALLERRQPSGIDVDTTLNHFCLVTYYVDADVVRTLIHPRFEPVTVTHQGRASAILSVVPFVDRDFRFVGFPRAKWQFHQTNYRIYVVDTDNHKHVAWFLGTSLDSMSVYIPRFHWKLPWHRASIEFDCEWDPSAKRYSRYRVATTNSWANCSLELIDTGIRPTSLDGFDDLEAGLVVLTHPRTGYYYRRDGKLGTYSIWHEQITPTIGTVQSCQFDLLDRLKLTDSSDTQNVHSVLMTPSVDFTIYLPPRVATVGKCPREETG